MSSDSTASSLRDTRHSRVAHAAPIPALYSVCCVSWFVTSLARLASSNCAFNTRDVTYNRFTFLLQQCLKSWWIHFITRSEKLQQQWTEQENLQNISKQVLVCSRVTKEGPGGPAPPHPPDKTQAYVLTAQNLPIWSVYFRENPTYIFNFGRTTDFELISKVQIIGLYCI